jgi:hypothetical protein
MILPVKYLDLSLKYFHQESLTSTIFWRIGRKMNNLTIEINNDDWNDYKEYIKSLKDSELSALNDDSKDDSEPDDTIY